MDMNIYQMLFPKKNRDILDRVGKRIFWRKTAKDVNKDIEGVSTNPIFVYQMGRVGSASVKLSLEQAYRSLSIKIPILHGHFLNNFIELENRVKEDLEDTSHFMSDLIAVNETFHKLMGEMNDPQKLKIISLVRDPVARNVSTFFFALNEFLPGWEQRIAENKLTVDEIHQIFLAKRIYVLTAFYWFEEQMQPVFDIDVYATPFPKEKGYKIYSSSKADLLLLRLESLNQFAEKAFVEYLSLPNFEIQNVNTGEGRRTGDLYRLFKTKPLPREYIEWTYNFKLARHFYTEEELKSFTRKWILDTA